MRQSAIELKFLIDQSTTHDGLSSHNFDDPDALAGGRRGSRCGIGSGGIRFSDPHACNQDVGQLGVASLERLSCLIN